MRLLERSHLLLGLAALAWTGVSAVTNCSEVCKAEGPVGSIAVVGEEYDSCDTRYTWNEFASHVEGNEIYLWISLPFTFNTSRDETFWLYDYSSNCFADSPDTLFPRNDSSRKDVGVDGSQCLAGHTKDYNKLYDRDCNEKLPAVCYYRETAERHCPTVEGTTGTLFRAKCYNRYSAPESDDYKTRFEVREECAKLEAKLLAAIHDQDTQENLSTHSAGKEAEISEVTEFIWIGLPQDGECASGCWWRADDRPLFQLNDTEPTNDFDKCSVTCTCKHASY